MSTVEKRSLKKIFNTSLIWLVVYCTVLLEQRFKIFEWVVVKHGSNGENVESFWTVKILGLRYTWTCVTFRSEQPRLIHWKSLTGLENTGIVKFYKKKGSTYNEGPTPITMKMACMVPRAFALIACKSKQLQSGLKKHWFTNNSRISERSSGKNDVKSEGTSITGQTGSAIFCFQNSADSLV